MAKKKIETLLADANSRLKASKIRVRITTRAESDRLYLKATLPPKPSSGKTKAYRQRISLGIDRTYACLKNLIISE